MINLIFSFQLTVDGVRKSSLSAASFAGLELEQNEKSVIALLLPEVNYVLAMPPMK